MTGGDLSNDVPPKAPTFPPECSNTHRDTQLSAAAARFLFQVKGEAPCNARKLLCPVKASLLIASVEAKTWGRATRARKKYTILKAKGVIWCGFEGLKPRNDGEVVTKGGSSCEWVWYRVVKRERAVKSGGERGSWCRSAVSRASFLSKRESIEKHDDLQRNLLAGSRINTSNSGLRSGCLTGRAEKQTGPKHKTVFPSRQQERMQEKNNRRSENRTQNAGS